MENEFFDRSRLLLGDGVMARLDTVRIIIFGVGGVGSWCAEALVRTGLRHLTVVDADVVCATNVNRQMMATTKTVGQVKVQALKERLQEINPDAVIDARHEMFTAETAADFALDSYDYVIDAIDSLQDKALLIEMACRTHAVFYSSMGAALKLDPASVRVAEFRKVKGCPLARALRQRFKKSGTCPAKKFMCVFSEEPPLPKPVENGTSGKGSLMHITAIFGLTIAGQVIKDIVSCH